MRSMKYHNIIICPTVCPTVMSFSIPLMDPTRGVMIPLLLQFVPIDIVLGCITKNFLNAANDQEMKEKKHSLVIYLPKVLSRRRTGID